jgi:molybdopterin converting factor small subunit
MSVRVEVPAEWASAADGCRVARVAGPTVGACLDALLRDYPGLASRFDAGRHEVFVNWVNTRQTGGPHTPVRAGDVIILLPNRS